ncbi:MAG: response regulator, partial [Rhodospirillales bacterium]|nr:response regulator [Rhodospirillales bacterium]
DARADTTRLPASFRDLGAALNAVVIRLTRDQVEQRRRADRAAAELGDRSRDLSLANNRLQVEIAERDKSEAALHHGQKLQAIGQLSGGIAHDFNNLLATILGSLELMERRVSAGTSDPTNTDRLRTLIERAIGAVQRGAQLTSGLLAFSRREPMPARPTDLNALIADLATLATSTLGRRIRLTTELTPSLWPAMVDPSQIEAAILNLCLNARDAMPDGGMLTIRTGNVVIDPSSSAPDLSAGDYVSVTVADTGIGMSAAVQRRAFDPFFTTKGDAGSGLGLSQVQSAARQAGGTVQLRSVEGEGTTITLLLPRGTDQAAPAKPAARAVETDALACLVLVVDDDHAVRQVAVEMLHDLGYQVVEAPGGAEALTLMTELRPDIILVDYAMPGMNGLQLTRALRDRGVTLPIAMVTGYAELDDSQAGKSPLDGLLRKPFTIQELQALLSTLRSKGERGSNVVRLNLAR